MAVITAFVLLFAACKKDFTTFTVSGWKPKLAAPLFSTSITLRDLIGNDSTIETQSDSALVYVYHQDSIFSVNADSLLQWKKQSQYDFRFSLGIVHVDNFGVNDSVSINDILSSLKPEDADTLRKYAGQNTIFPKFNILQPYTMNVTGLDNFQQLHFSSGSLHINAHNTLPVAFDTLYYDLIDQSNGDHLAEVRITNLLPGTTQSKTIDLSNKTISNSLSVRINKMNSHGSYPDKVLINLNQGIRFQVTTNQLQVISGTAKIPAQTVTSDQKLIDFNFQEGAELTQLQIETGSFTYDINSSIATELNIHMALPSGEQNKTAPTKDLFIPANGTVHDSWDLSQLSLDLSTDNNQAFNRIPITFEAEIPATNQFISFDSSNQITASLRTGDIRLESATGYLGQQTYVLDPDSISFDLDFLNKLNGELILDNPEMILNYKNGFGVPIQLNMDFRATNSEDGTVQPLNLEPITFLYPSTMGQDVYGSTIIDKNNSSIVDFLSLRPDIIRYSGNILINPDGRTTNFVNREADFTASADIRIPLIIQANKLRFTDTITGLRISKEDVPAESGTIKAIISNGFPVEARIQLSFPDSVSGQNLTTLDFGKIDAAPVDQSGKVTQASQSEINIEIAKDFFDKVARANSGIIHVETTTFNNGTVPVQLFSDYQFKVSVGISATLTP